MGTRNDYTMKENSRKDHPHAYGDKRLATEDSTISAGSSPRVWGQGVGEVYSVIRVGIIPTRVGTS